jgi:putative Ca2+/H+ antiporter (TMEM165/GDT1 family)
MLKYMGKGVIMFSDYIGAFMLIFFAEMGDKTQFLAMAFATKYPVKKILLGVALGSLLNHGLAMILGRALLTVLPQNLITIIAGCMFIFFAFMSLKLDDDAVEEEKSKFGPVLTVALAFFIGELGDKTQLAALGLAVDANFWYIALLGTVTGMVVTSALGIFVGLKLGRNLPENYLKISAFSIFMFFGFQKLSGELSSSIPSIWMITIVVMTLIVSLTMVVRFNKKYKSSSVSAFRLQAEKLKQTREKIMFKIADICHGKEHCGVCDGSNCLVGFMRHTLSHADEPISEKKSARISQLKNKGFNKDEAKDILNYLIDYYTAYPNEFTSNKVLTTLRHSVEYLIMEKLISTDSYNDYLREINKYR